MTTNPLSPSLLAMASAWAEQRRASGLATDRRGKGRRGTPQAGEVARVTLPMVDRLRLLGVASLGSRDDPAVIRSLISCLWLALGGEFGEDQARAPRRMLAERRGEGPSAPTLPIEVVFEGRALDELGSIRATMACSTEEAIVVAIRRQHAVDVELGELSELLLPTQPPAPPAVRAPPSPGPPREETRPTKPPRPKRPTSRRGGERASPALCDAIRPVVARSPLGMNLRALAPRGFKTHVDIKGEEELHLIQAAQAGDKKAMGALLLAHEGSVWSAMKRWGFRAEDKEGALQEIRMGLMRAVAKYDPTAGASLLTYATMWMRQTVTRYIDEDEGDIRIPVHAAERVRKARKLGAKSAEEAVAITGSEPAGLAWSLYGRADRLDRPAGEDPEGYTLLDRVATGAAGPEERLRDEERAHRCRGLIREALGYLAPRERAVVERRLLSEEGATLQEVGDELNLSRERIRQIEGDALWKLKRALAFMRVTREAFRRDLC